MEPKVIVFDFDGTLIDSNRLKYDAYFELFPKDKLHSQVIERVLATKYEESRFSILAEILHGLETKASPVSQDPLLNELANRYNDLVVSGAKTCPEMPGAEKSIKYLSTRYRLSVSSTTPDTPLREIIEHRGWAGYFVDSFGYPHKKARTLQLIKKQEGIDSSELLVVGDGESDRTSARENRCRFIHVDRDFRLETLCTGINND